MRERVALVRFDGRVADRVEAWKEAQKWRKLYPFR